MVLWILIDVVNFSFCQIFQIEAMQNVNIANFVYYWKTRKKWIIHLYLFFNRFYIWPTVVNLDPWW